MTHKEADGSTRNDRDSETKCPGAERFDGGAVLAGSIIARRCGTRFHAGTNVGCDRDHTPFTLTDGKVKFEVKDPKNRRSISVITE